MASGSAGVAYEKMKNAIAKATPKAATIGTAKIKGVPMVDDRASFKKVVGSTVMAETTTDDDASMETDWGCDDDKASKRAGLG